MKILGRILITIAVFTVGVYSQHDHHAPESPAAEKSEKTELLDEFGKLGHCDLTGRYDAFFAELSQRSDAVGYVIVYQGADALPANYDDPPMGRMFKNHMAFRNFDASRVVVIDGGFQEELRTELWIVPPGGEKPEPRNTVKAPVMPSDLTFLFDSSGLLTDDSGESVDEFVLPSVKAARDAEMAASAAESESEDSSETTNETPEPIAENTEDEPEIVAEEYVDERTPEEIDAYRFSWTSEKFGDHLAKRKHATGVMILYADDQTYDIERFKQFIEQGKKRLADAAGIKPDRISIRFGGYRDFPEVDYWIVPAKGKEPVATPAERPVEEQQTEPTEN